MKVQIDKKGLEKICNESLSIAEVCRKLDIRPVGGNYKTLKIKFRDYKIDISHFTGKAWNQGNKFKYFGKKYKLEEILIENSTYTNLSYLKERLVKAKILKYECEICKIINWNNKALTLELDHKNGNNLDHRLENIRLLCPNCHSQTNNFRGKKETKSACSEMRKERSKSIKNRSKHIKKKNSSYENYCLNCSKNCLNKFCSQMCYKEDLRKKIPNIDELLDKFKQHKSFLRVSKEYNVSDNAVRKWCKIHNILELVK